VSYPIDSGPNSPLSDISRVDVPGAGSGADLQRGADRFVQGLLAIVQGLVADVPIVGDIVEALTGVEDGDYTDLGTFASLLFGRDVSLASRVSKIENKIAIGAQYFDDFNRGDNDAVLGEGWTQGGNGQVLGIHDQAAQLKRDPLPDDGVRYAICPQVASADTVTVSAVIHPKGTPPAPRTSLFLRANAALTEFVYVNLFGGKCYLGRGTRSGNSWSFTDWKSNLTRSYSNSSTIEFKAEGTHYQLVIDGVLILDHTDVSGYPVDSSHRTVGFSLQTWTAILAVPQFSGGLASFALRSAVELEAVAVAQSTAAAAQTTATAANTTANTANEAATGLTATASDHENRITILEAGDQIAEFNSSGTWIKPASMRGHVSIALAGGGGGRKGPPAIGSPELPCGGGQGGYAEAYTVDASMPASVAVTIGAGGLGATADNTNGGSGSPTVIAGIVTAGAGLGGTASTPIAGTGTHPEWQANGGRGAFNANPATPGGNGYLAAGGAAGANGGNGAPGGNGVDCPPGSIGPGGGGGGGGYATGLFANGGRGGNGGFPSGGAGAGGRFANGGFVGNGGNGGNGRGFILSSARRA
jgi:hypothetical protein